MTYKERIQAKATLELAIEWKAAVVKWFFCQDVLGGYGYNQNNLIQLEIDWLEERFQELLVN